MALAKRAPAKRPAILETRPLTPDDLAVLRTHRPNSGQKINELRDSHHLVARLVAAGLRNDEVADRSGFSMASVYRFTNDPAFQELVAQYRKVVDDSFREETDSFHSLLLSNRMKAERRLADRLDDDEAAISTRDLVTISRDAADRTGYGKHSTQTNHHVGMGTALENAWKRLGRSPPMLEATASRLPAAPPAPTDAPPQAAVINRRGL